MKDIKLASLNILQCNGIDIFGIEKGTLNTNTDIIHNERQH